MQSGPELLAALANYFGERPLEIRLHDTNPEFLILNYELARVLLQLNKSTHQLKIFEDKEEALEGIDGLIQLPPYLESQTPTGQFENGFESKVNLLALGNHLEPPFRSLENWPPNIETPWPGFQVMRWIRGEEYPYELLKRNKDAPIRRWLENPDVPEL